MSYQDFLQGKTGERVRREKEQAIELERLETYKAICTEEERLLGILRPCGETIEAGQNPFHTWLKLRGPQISISSSLGGLEIKANEWYDSFPESVKRYGPPFLRDQSINYDMLGSLLGEASFSLRYQPTDGLFYYSDYLRELAYRPTTDSRVEAVYRSIIWKASENTPQSSIKPLLALRNESRRVIASAKELLAVEPLFFAGENGKRRYIDGRYVEPEKKPSYSLFAEEVIIPRKGETLTISEAKDAYGRYCSLKSVPPVRSKLLSEGLSKEIQGRFGLTMRHDINKAGRTAKGWSGISLQPIF